MDENWLLFVTFCYFLLFFVLCGVMVWCWGFRFLGWFVVWDWGLVDNFFCRALMTPRYLVPNMRFCSGKFD